MFALVLTALVSTLCLPVYANGNEWVYDEARVISVETEEHIKVLNEETFSAYKTQPRLYIVVVNNMPAGVSMEEYRSALFERHGGGCDKDNYCMLLVLDIKAYQYAFEIGPGFAEGSALKEALETEFVSDDAKDLLSQEKYDEFLVAIGEHVAGILADEQYDVNSATPHWVVDPEGVKLAALVAGILFVLFFGIYLAFLCTAKRSRIRILLEENHKLVTFLGEDKKTLRKYLLNYRCTASELEDDFVELLYGFYVERELEKLRLLNLNKPFVLYESHFKSVNKLEAFKYMRTKDLCEIVAECDNNLTLEG